MCDQSAFYVANVCKRKGMPELFADIRAVVEMAIPRSGRLAYVHFLFGVQGPSEHEHQASYCLPF